ncbi:hypothetical protein RRF57_010600 [Xylaria bambusicola]|uniref:Uncharacterized protein n=1 Tax=Xylaria bambusicola TaxID=326684 RepID=A0AAN7USN9_9PEZI
MKSPPATRIEVRHDEAATRVHRKSTKDLEHTTDATYMQLTILSPRKVIQYLEDVNCHVRCPIPHQRLIRTTHSSVVKKKDRVPVTVKVPKMHSLPLPRCLEHSQALDELQ